MDQKEEELTLNDSFGPLSLEELDQVNLDPFDSEEEFAAVEHSAECQPTDKIEIPKEDFIKQEKYIKSEPDVLDFIEIKHENISGWEIDLDNEQSPVSEGHKNEKYPSYLYVEKEEVVSSKLYDSENTSPQLIKTIHDENNILLPQSGEFDITDRANINENKVSQDLFPKKGGQNVINILKSRRRKATMKLENISDDMRGKVKELRKHRKCLCETWHKYVIEQNHKKYNLSSKSPRKYKNQKSSAAYNKSPLKQVKRKRPRKQVYHRIREEFPDEKFLSESRNMGTNSENISNSKTTFSHNMLQDIIKNNGKFDLCKSENVMQQLSTAQNFKDYHEYIKFNEHNLLADKYESKQSYKNGTVVKEVFPYTRQLFSDLENTLIDLEELDTNYDLMPNNIRVNMNKNKSKIAESYFTTDTKWANIFKTGEVYLNTSSSKTIASYNKTDVQPIFAGKDYGSKENILKNVSAWKHLCDFNQNKFTMDYSTAPVLMKGSSTLLHCQNNIRKISQDENEYAASNIETYSMQTHAFNVTTEKNICLIKAPLVPQYKWLQEYPRIMDTINTSADVDFKIMDSSKVNIKSTSITETDRKLALKDKYVSNSKKDEIPSTTFGIKSVIANESEYMPETITSLAHEKTSQIKENNTIEYSRKSIKNNLRKSLQMNTNVTESESGEGDTYKETRCQQVTQQQKIRRQLFIPQKEITYDVRGESDFILEKADSCVSKISPTVIRGVSQNFKFNLTRNDKDVNMSPEEMYKYAWDSCEINSKKLNITIMIESCFNIMKDFNKEQVKKGLEILQNFADKQLNQGRKENEDSGIHTQSWDDSIENEKLSHSVRQDSARNESQDLVVKPQLDNAMSNDSVDLNMYKKYKNITGENNILKKNTKSSFTGIQKQRRIVNTEIRSLKCPQVKTKQTKKTLRAQHPEDVSTETASVLSERTEKSSPQSKKMINSQDMKLHRVSRLRNPYSLRSHCKLKGKCICKIS